MHRTFPLRKGGGRMISAAHGQRRILKRKLPLLEYIEKAVETGVYRSNDEIQAAVRAMKRGDPTKREPEVALDRFRKDIIRGTQVQDYPFEYHLLKMYPPLPFQPKIPKKELRRLENERKKHPTEKLVAHYMKRQEKPEATTEEFYQNLLGIHPPAENFAMGHKSAALSKAYAFAVKQYEVMRTQDVSEKEALGIVDNLLAEDKRKGAHVSRKNVDNVKEWRKAHDAHPDLKLDENEVSCPSILHDRPRVVQGLLEWGNMLRGPNRVPYSEWTVGASTALDHWIARNILDMSESTWDQLLEGTDPALLSRGQDIVAVRETLFPETQLEVEDHSDEFFEQKAQEEEMELERQRDERAAMSFGDPPKPPLEDEPNNLQSVDQLLKTLRGLHDDDDDDDEAEQGVFGKSIPTQPSAGLPEKTHDGTRDPIQVLTDELQDWRAMNVKSPYEQWPDSEKRRFSQWLDRYLDVLTSENDRSLVDREETRIALLSKPPQTEEESENFWNSLQDETKADIFLQNLLQKGPPEGLTEEERAFWSLPYEDQLENLLNTGALRPMMDEYLDDESRADFMRRYGDFLLDGVELEHLVPDPQGAITGMELGSDIIRAWNIQPDDRFSLVKLPYKAAVQADGNPYKKLPSGDDDDNQDDEATETGSELAMKRSRALYQAWNKQKAGRARYEEQMFMQGDLGLSYGTKSRNEIEAEYEERSMTEENPEIDIRKPKGKKKW